MTTTNPGSGLPSVTAAAIPGARHVLTDGAPCQDAARATRASDHVVLSVADGHGGLQYVYSHVGARMAVEVATHVLASAVESGTISPRARGMAQQQQLARQIALRWGRYVAHDHHGRCQAFMDHVESSSAPDETLPSDHSEATKLYGTTLLAAAITDRYATFLQLGDGASLIVDQEDHAELLFEDDPRPGSATYSLALEDCVQQMRFRSIDLAERPLKLAMLCSDGIAGPLCEDAILWTQRLAQRFCDMGWTRALIHLTEQTFTFNRLDGDDTAFALAYWK
jgi:serine/threonine protein phosphatase PrpC